MASGLSTHVKPILTLEIFCRSTHFNARESMILKIKFVISKNIFYIKYIASGFKNASA